MNIHLILSDAFTTRQNNNIFVRNNNAERSTPESAGGPGLFCTVIGNGRRMVMTVSICRRSSEAESPPQAATLSLLLSNSKAGNCAGIMCAPGVVRINHDNDDPSSLSPSTALFCNGDNDDSSSSDVISSSLVVDTVAHQLYYLLVTTPGETGRDFYLSVMDYIPPFNDHCWTAQPLDPPPLDGYSRQVYGSAVNATNLTASTMTTLLARYQIFSTRYKSSPYTTSCNAAFLPPDVTTTTTDGEEENDERNRKADAWSVWYSLQGRGRNTILHTTTTGTVGRSVNRLMVYTTSSTTCVDLVCVAVAWKSNSDTWENYDTNTATTTLSFDAELNSTYYIAVQTLAMEENFALEYYDREPPTNNELDQAISLLVSNGSPLELERHQFIGSNVNATSVYNKMGCGSDVDVLDHVVYYQVVGTGRRMTLTTWSPGNHVSVQIQVFQSGTDCAPHMLKNLNPDWSSQNALAVSHTINTINGDLYDVYIYGQEETQFGLFAYDYVPPLNSHCANAVDLDLYRNCSHNNTPFVLMGSTVNATHRVWYSFVARQTQRLQISSCFQV